MATFNAIQKTLRSMGQTAIQMFKTQDVKFKKVCSNIHTAATKNIAKLSPDAKKLLHAFVSSWLDNCNALLIGIPDRNLKKLQYIQTVPLGS
ncbi:unnamed protein product [Lota lota]